MNRLSFVVLVCLLLASGLPAWATVYTWTGAAGDNNWSDQSNWSPNGVPSSTDSVIFDTSAMPSAGTTGNLTNTASLTVNNGLTLYGPTWSNSGSVDFAGGACTIDGSTTLSGSGSVQLNSAGIDLNGGAFTNTGNLIHGSGGVGYGTGSFLNQGTITADVSGSYLGVSNVTNAGTLSAIGGGILSVESPLNNASGTIAVGSDSILSVYDGAINGGTLNGSGTVLVTTGTFTSVTNSALVQVSGLQYTTYDSLYLSTGTIINNGTIAVTGSFNSLNFGGAGVGGTLTLAGSGTVTLSGTCGIYQAAPGRSIGTTFVNAGNLIHGAGTFQSPQATVINQGTISADVSGGTLDLAVGGVVGGVTNSGTLSAINGGTLAILAPVSNTSGTLTAGANSTIYLAGGVTGGTINGAGTVLATSSGILTSLTNSALISVGRGTNGAVQLTLGAGTVTNNGQIDVAGVLTNSAAVSLSGNGTVTLSGSGEIAAYGAFTNVSQLIDGAGVVDEGGVTLSNSGTISADSGGTLTFEEPGTLSHLNNSGTLAAANGGTLVVGVQMTSTGTITAGLNSTVLLAGDDFGGVTLNGGTINGSGTVDLLYNCHFGNGTLTNNGLIFVANIPSYEVDAAIPTVGTTTFAGTGGVLLGDSGLNCNGNLINASNLIHGSGSIYAGSAQDLITNDGTIAADAGGASLALSGALSGNSPALEYSNAGTLLATNGGTLNIQASVTNSGAILALGASTIAISANVSGGTVGVEGGGTVNVSAGTLSRSAIAGNFVLAGGDFAPQLAGVGTIDSLDITGATLTLRLLANGSCGSLAVQGPATLGGDLSLVAATGFVPQIGASYILIQGVDGGTLSGSFANVGNGQLIATTNGSSEFLLTINPGVDGDVTLSEVVPEPRLLGPLLLGVMALAERRRRAGARGKRERLAKR